MVELSGRFPEVDLFIYDEDFSKLVSRNLNIQPDVDTSESGSNPLYCFYNLKYDSIKYLLAYQTGKCELRDSRTGNFINPQTGEIIRFRHKF